MSNARNLARLLPDSSGKIQLPSQVAGLLPKTNAPSGSVLQTVQSVKTDTASTTSTTFGDVTGLSVSITPISASSKILVLLTLGGIGNATNAIRFNLLRNGTNIAQPDTGTNSSTLCIFPGGGTGIFNSAISWLDLPATISSVTYKVQWCVDLGTGYLNRHTSNTNFNSVSSITVMEIAA